MSALTTTAALYGRVALQRRRALLRYTTVRAALAIAAALLLLTGIALANAVAFLLLRPHLGDIGAICVLCGAHFLAGGLALALALKEPYSPELAALADAESAAYDAVSAEASAIVTVLRSVESKLEVVGSNLALGLDVFSALKAKLGHSSEETLPSENKDGERHSPATGTSSESARP